MVIVAIPSMKEGGLTDDINPRFGRCSSFTFVELENNEIKAVKTVPNHAINSMGGAGVQATQIIGNNKAEVVIVGFLGPNAANGLNALNIKIFHAPNRRMTIKEIIDLYRHGELKPLSSANVASHYGMGAGQNLGGRRSMGRGNHL
ncbi:MAG: NifB/NifX family molybdenum-iron cluster-binding protein [Candidatus Hermodarchaeota archaeon]